MVDIFKGYFEVDFDEDSLRDNFTLVYELLDEMLDFGYPQNCALDVLKMYINLGSLRAPTSAAADKQMTSTITGARDWRRDGIKHKKNEVFLDVDESVNLLVSASGAVLKNDVSAKIVLKALLSGMPECKLGLNDKVVMEKDGGGKSKKAGVDIDDCTFHRCVQLGKFDSDRTITFVPPDGEFELMRYRITENVILPFRVIPSIEEIGNTKVVLNIKVIANFESNLFATNVAIKIPVSSTQSVESIEAAFLFVCVCVCNPHFWQGRSHTVLAYDAQLISEDHFIKSPYHRLSQSPLFLPCPRPRLHHFPLAAHAFQARKQQLLT